MDAKDLPAYLKVGHGRSEVLEDCPREDEAVVGPYREIEELQTFQDDQKLIKQWAALGGHEHDINEVVDLGGYVGKMEAVLCT